MDWIRTCYTVDMQFDEAGELIAPVTWYRAASTAVPLPVPHYYGSSRTWSEHHLGSIGLGERWDSVPAYSNGAAPGYFPGNGSICGPLDWFSRGCPSDAPPIDYGGLSTPPCCPQPICQPWYYGSGGVGDREYSVSGWPNPWYVTQDVPDAYVLYDPITEASIRFSLGIGSCPGTTLGTYCEFSAPGLYPGGPMTCGEVSPSQFLGTYYVPDGASGYPFGFVITFICPPS